MSRRHSPKRSPSKKRSPSPSRKRSPTRKTLDSYIRDLKPRMEDSDSESSGGATVTDTQKAKLFDYFMKKGTLSQQDIKGLIMARVDNLEERVRAGDGTLGVADVVSSEEEYVTSPSAVQKVYDSASDSGSDSGSDVLEVPYSKSANVQRIAEQAAL